MDLRHLRTFVTVAERGTVSKASLRLHVAQPALSRQISDLHGAGRTEPPRAQDIGRAFARQGYVFLYLFRRGYGLSATQGEFMRDVLDREARARGEEGRRRLQLVLLTTSPEAPDLEMMGLTRVDVMWRASARDPSDLVARDPPSRSGRGC